MGKQKNKKKLNMTKGKEKKEKKEKNEEGKGKEKKEKLMNEKEDVGKLLKTEYNVKDMFGKLTEEEEKSLRKDIAYLAKDTFYSNTEELKKGIFYYMIRIYIIFVY